MGSFPTDNVLKFRGIRSGVPELWWFKFEGVGIPKFSALPSGKIISRIVACGEMQLTCQSKGR